MGLALCVWQVLRDSVVKSVRRLGRCGSPRYRFQELDVEHRGVRELTSAQHEAAYVLHFTDESTC